MQTVGLVAAVESTTILGGVLGWFLLRNVSEIWLALALANAGGGFFFLAVHAMLGEIFRHHKGLVLGNFAAGFCIIATLILYLHLKA
jgi:zinc transporter ZupT